MNKSDRRLKWALEIIGILKKKKEAPSKRNVPSEIVIAGKEQVKYVIDTIQSDVKQYMEKKKLKSRAG